ncbi:SPOR domain-containing protein [Novosphingobium sp. 9U]|uniref:SPOR domain-containing protein n=1 Tax=Novosphingobium sp. 9U TaxID=2653158 RepID=UPI0012EF0D30|nr:SPOR domain-containing protein [Novosphingobium sp. 9U]VWX52843.1 conserved hypothetical protein [Novosphingobium sp. 9U]
MTMSFPGEGGRDEPGFKDGDDTAAPAHGAGQRPFDSRFEETGELDLGEEDVRLPWLEGDDDDYEDVGSNTGQLIALVLLGLVALALIVGGIWWLQRDKPDTALVADGETIQAPAAPYKTKPADPGGEVVAGTGDTSFAVAEGQTRQVRMGNETPAPANTPKAATTPGASPSAAASEAAPADVSGVGVQVGAYSNRESAEKGWTRLSQQYEALGSVKHRIVEGRADIGTVYRLQAVPGDAAAANRLCGTLKAAGLSCQVKR